MKVFVAQFFFFVLLAGFFGTTAWADEDDEMFMSLRRGPVAKDHLRTWPGARDEQMLDVQPSLAQPTRSPDGSAIVLDNPLGTDAPATPEATD